MAEARIEQPGEARCPGPSTMDIIRDDNDNVAAPLLQEQYEFLGDNDIPYSRYTSQAFYDLEMERLWTKTWQWACREEHVPNVGDYYVYDIGHYSYIICRSAKDEIKAYVNSCLHRGMQLVDPGTEGKGKQFFRCPFHGFSWNIDGSLRDIPCRWDFPHLKDEEMQLPEISVGLWGGFVFINPDPDAAPLEQHLEVLPEHFRDWPLEDRYVEVHAQKLLPANWKMGAEAFLEAYHVLATHPEGLKTAGDANAQYDIFGENVTRFVHTIGYPSPHLKTRPSEEEMLELMGGTNPAGAGQPLPEGESARSLRAAQLREELGEKYGVDLSSVSASEMLDSIEYFLFPNMFLFPGISLPMIYRFRPVDVDHCIHEILFLAPVGSDGKRPPPAKVSKIGIEDSYTSIEEFPQGLAFVYDQDTDNLRRQRDGAKCSVRGAQALGNYQESRVRRLHMTVDRYLDAAPD